LKISDTHSSLWLSNQLKKSKMATSHSAIQGTTVDFVPIKRALLSVSDKNGLVEFATKLASFGVELISTGGTAAALKNAGLNVIEIDSFTGSPEMLSGRVKTLHPRVHGALLAVRGNSTHEDDIRKYSLALIDMVVVNLYPFESTVASGASFEQCIENIDIGGPAMIRSSAKNHAYVSIVTDPSQYDSLAKELSENTGSISYSTRKTLAAAAFAKTSQYDTAISNYFIQQSKQ
jgi:phosphoribosylaminoimidazolecarboxamide formyltransferase/IMP cyclohydrolase